MPVSQEPTDIAETRALGEKIEKYGRRFVTIYHNIRKKEDVPNEILNESLQAAMISCQLSTIIQGVVEKGGTPEDVENLVKGWLHLFSENMKAQAENAITQILQAQELARQQEENDAK